MSELPLVLAVHGTRNPAGGQVSEGLRAAVADRLPGVEVRLGWVDIHTPTVTDTLTELGPCVVVPCFLTAGYHVESDLPEAAATAGGQAVITTLIGDEIFDAVVQRLTESGALEPANPADAVVLAHAGSLREQSVAEVHAVADRLSRRLGRPVVAAFLSAAGPDVGSAVAELRAGGHRRIAIASYLLAPGIFHSRLAGFGADVVAEPIGVHPLLIEGILRRYAEAVAPVVPAGSPVRVPE